MKIFTRVSATLILLFYVTMSVAGVGALCISHVNNLQTIDESVSSNSLTEEEESVDLDYQVSETSEPVMVEETTESTIVTNPSIEDAVSSIVSGEFGCGEERKAKLVELGFTEDEITEIYDRVNQQFPVATQADTTTSYVTSGGNVLTKSGGVSYNNPLGLRETWYSQRVLSGHGLNIPGRHVDERGFVCDVDGYICLAIDNNYFPKGTVVMTSNGAGKVYDHCPSHDKNGRPVIDVYVNW